MPQRPVDPAALLTRAVEELRTGNPIGAVRNARAAARASSDPFAAAMALGGILIDAGSDLKRRAVVAEGVSLLNSVRDVVPSGGDSAYFYNVGNGFSALAHFERGRGPATRPSVSEAISNLDESLRFGELPDVRTNLANALRQEGRLIEALDEYEAVLAAHPNHHQALANRGYALMHVHRWATNHRALLTASLRDHERAITLATDEPKFQKSYRAVSDWLRPRAPSIDPLIVVPTKYEAWIWSNRLALNPCPICQLDTPGTFDLYPVSGMLAGGRRRPPIEVVSDLVNTLCQSYATARWLLYTSEVALPSEGEHVAYQPGSSAARFGLRPGLLMAAISSFYSVLNQVAFAMKSYLSLDTSRTDTKLTQLWGKNYRKKGFPLTRAAVWPRFRDSHNEGLTALYGLSRSIEKGGGRYYPLRDLRNSIEHEAVIATESRVTSPTYYRAETLARLRTSAFDLGRVAKASVWYFGAAVLHEEQKRASRAARRGQRIVRGHGPNIQRA